jgi:3-oxoacyl-[acyl-carrier-protein] synthase-1
VQEAVHCLLMLEQGFVAGSANIEELDLRAEGLPVLRASEDAPALRTIMSNNFGFGGTNACVVFHKPPD